jgi:hypothetical protein
MRGSAARALAEALASRIGTLAPELLPAGHRAGRHWRCGSLAGEPGQSLAINLTGDMAGIWHDFATGEAGDALDLVAQVLFRGDVRAAMDWARRWLGLPEAGDRAPAPIARREPTAKAEAESEAGRGWRRAAVALFRAAKAPVLDTPVEAYLAGRGIDLRLLPHTPRALRFHPACPCLEAGRELPAMVAAIVSPAGDFLGTHRTWLAPDPDTPGGWRKAALRDPKKTLGRYAGGFVPLSRGASGKPMKQAPGGEAVAIAEGIETALSIAIARPDLRVVSAVALPNMRRVSLPGAVRRVILCADNDGDNPRSRALLETAARRFAEEGREVLIARPPEGFKDFNDLLCAAEAPND